MENKSSSLSPEDSIRIISEMISKTKEEFSNNSFYFLLWGYTISFACVLQFILLKVLLAKRLYSYIAVGSGILWGLCVIIAIIIQFVYVAKKEKRTKVKSYVSEYMTLNWQVNAALIILTGLFCWKYNIQPSPFILAVCGAATLVSGIIIKHKALIIGSIFLLIFSIITLWIDNDYQLLLTALAIILGYIIPGYSLKKLNK